MDEKQWLACTDPYEMFDFIVTTASDRKLRLFACACCRSIWHLQTDALFRNAVEVAEEFANGLSTDSALNTAFAAAAQAVEGAGKTEPHLDALATAEPRAWRAAEQAFDHTINAILFSDEPGYWAKDAGFRASTYRSAAAAICERLREVIGNPIRPSKVDPSWLTATVQNLAAGVQKEGRFDMLPILGDALEDAGCSSPDILSHCRQQQAHANGCWVLDLLLGFEPGERNKLNATETQEVRDAEP